VHFCLPFYFSFILVITLHYHFIPAPKTTLDVGVQEAAHQSLIVFCQELRDLNCQWLSEMEKKYVQKIEDLQAWERVQERKIQALQDLSYAQKGIILRL
jgi:hypothetical protein